VTPAYLAAVHLQLADTARLARGGEWLGTYHTRSQVLGRIEFVAWVNPGRRPDLIRRYNSISWKKVEEEAQQRGLVAPRKLLIGGRADSDTNRPTTSAVAR
jgi:hypothetical protein